MSYEIEYRIIGSVVESKENSDLDLEPGEISILPSENSKGVSLPKISSKGYGLPIFGPEGTKIGAKGTVLENFGQF